MLSLSRLVFAVSLVAVPAMAQTPPALREALAWDSFYVMGAERLGTWRYRALDADGAEGSTSLGKTWIEVEDPYGGRILIPQFYQQSIQTRVQDAVEGRSQRVNIDIPRATFYVLLGLLGGAVVLVAILPLYVYRRRYLKELDKRRQLQEARRQLAESREDERRQLARELHDGPLQDLHALRMQLGLAADALDGDAAARPRVRGAQDDAHTVVEDLRRITEALRPPALGPFGLSAALSAHADRFRRRHPGIEVRLALAPDGLKLPEPIRLALFRIAQEAMNNAAKHGPPATLRLELDLSDDEVCLIIEDDGPGLGAVTDFSALAADGHFGLLGMQERADAVSGTLHVANRSEGGFRVQVSVPRAEAVEEAPGR
ncbi:hypothetical protein B1759_10215 [Rubrivirga sp. SAORIC476]|uniref:sensor histidine kinase n=1 Tax=Rubrivirga sp. SAORIC476 TaxID=1961794 RepID=UPI000BA9182E|nr:sensor histidine kinase [Rubrivirga sp. SAORIC476]PAP81664.1 hypothetical protein B1759_10215 [Rubrivirga sp. SAORIC476]